MNSFCKIIIINFFIFSIIGSSFANEKIAFINLDYIIKNSNIGKKVLDKIEKQNKKNINLLEKKNKSLKDLELEIKNKKNLISEKDFNLEVLTFQNKIQDYTNEKNTLVREFNDLRAKEIENIFSMFSPIISSYMKENSINILFDSKNIFMGDPDSNLSEVVLKKINNELK